MHDDTSLEDRLESIGAALRERPRLTDRVMDEVRKSAPDDPRPALATRGLRFTVRSHQRLVSVSLSAVASIAAALLIAVVFFPSQSAGWQDVTKAIQSQKWIRGTREYGDGKRATMWLSPERQIWAFRLDNTFYFYDGRERTKYEYLGGKRPITKLPLGEDDAQRVLPINALAQGTDTIGSWLMGTEKIVEQKRREFTESGKTWIEFQLVLSRGDMNQATLRVDPETRLPVFLLSTSKDHTQTAKWEFDYPTEGPTDIYALGIPRDIKLDDRMPSDDVLRILNVIAASRASIGDFRLFVGLSPSYPSAVVYRTGNRWRVDSWRPQTAVDSVPDGSHERDWDKWFAEQLQLSQPQSLFVCDGKTVWENTNFRPGDKPQWQPSRHLAPQDLMSGEGLGMLPMAPGAKIASLLFPDLSPKPGWGFEFVPNPLDAPGCVLIKRSAKTSFPNTTAHEWYYLDPAKGYAVVRADLFNLPNDVPGNPKNADVRQLITMEDFRQSPQGFWYSSVVHDNQSISNKNSSVERSEIRKLTTTTRYVFEFDPDLPDSHFTIDDEPLSEQK